MRVALQELSARLLVAADPAAAGCVVFTAAEPGAGVSELLASLVIHAAASWPELRLAAVDFNLRTPRLAALLDAPASPGVADILAARSDMAACTVRVRLGDDATDAGFDLIPAGHAERHCRPFSNVAAIETLLAALANRYDCVLIDAPAAGACGDARLLAAHADGAVLVARAGHTRRAALAAAREQIEAAGAVVRGVVLNQVR